MSTAPWHAASDILDGALRMYRHHFLALITRTVGILLVILGIRTTWLLLQGAWLGWSSLSPLSLDPLLQSFRHLRSGQFTLSDGVQLSVGVGAFVLVESVLIAALVPFCAQQYLHMFPASPRIANPSRGRILALLPTTLPLLLLTGVGVLLARPLVDGSFLLCLFSGYCLDSSLERLRQEWVPPLLSSLLLLAISTPCVCAAPIALIEGVSGWTSMRQSWRASRRLFWPLITVSLLLSGLTTLLWALPTTCYLIMELLWWASLPSDLRNVLPIVAALASKAGLVLVLPIQLMTITLVYIEWVRHPTENSKPRP